MLAIAIVEDDPAQQRHMVGLLRQYEGEKGYPLEIDCFSNGADFLEEYSGHYALIFLDIQMRQMDGLETAERIRQLDEGVHLVFATNFAQHAIDGYRVEASDFLLKPVAYPMICRVMNRVRRVQERQSGGYLVFHNSRKLQRVPLDSVRYVESIGHYVKVHTGQDAPLFLGSLREVEQQLEGLPFFRCSVSYIVSLAHVEAIDQYRVLVAGDWLTVSRQKKKELMQALNRYVSGGWKGG